MKNFTWTVVLTLVICASQADAVRAQAHDPSLPGKIDAIVEKPIREGRVAGASVAVVHRGRTIVSKGYGLADIELDVPTPPRATYEIGSITKQFTAASILLLAEQGKLSLEDDLTHYLPEYPTQGHRITLRRLLNHTSGIKGYTEMPEFREFQMLRKPKEDLVKLFSAQPFDFKPGEEQIYNNSAFFLLGLVIEKVSGRSYADFVQEYLFDRVGMKDSYYCSERKIRKNHAHGYDTDQDGLVLKAYLDHRWPYAAGSLCSNTSDLIAWNQALHGGKVLSASSYQEMTAPGVLNDGTRLRYGLGIGLSDVLGRRALHHGGGIPGFLSQSTYFPDDDLIVVVLLNTSGPVSPDALAQQIGEAVLGPPPAQAVPFRGDLEDFVATFVGRGRGRESRLRILRDSNQLWLEDLENPRAEKRPLVYRGGDQFGARGSVLTFERASGRVVRLRLDTGSGHNVLSRTSP